MKKIFILSLTALIAVSCGVATHTRVTETTFLDYRPYTSSGFFLSPDPYPGSFDALGEIRVEIVPAILPRTRIVETRSAGFEDGLYSSGTTPRVNHEDIDAADMLDAAVKAAKEVGADGLVSLRQEKRLTDDPYNPVIYVITGLAISRK